MRSVVVELMRFWSDRIENLGNEEKCSVSTRELISLIAGLYDRLHEYKLSILCHYLTYGTSLDVQRATKSEVLDQPTDVLVLRGLSKALMRMGNYVAGRKFLTKAIDITDNDPEAAPD